jgi:polyphosphate glucokinase
VNVQTGELVQERFRIETPQPATPEAVGNTVKQLVEHFKWKGPIGCTFPAIVQQGVTLSAANVDKSWINAPAEEILSKAVGQKVHVLNDADAAGLAEAAFGAAKVKNGTVLVITLGTGIGSALIFNGQLIPNSELGHLIFPKDDIAEHFCSAKVKEANNDAMKWKEYAARLNAYLLHIQLLFSPVLIVIGGGISKKGDKYIPLLEGMRCPVVTATLKNEAGIAGAALQASRLD